MSRISPKNLPQKTEDLQKLLVQFMEDAFNMNPELDEDEGMYDLVYIGTKLAKCSSFLQKLSDMQMMLTTIRLHVIGQTSTSRALLSLTEKQLKASEEYANTPREKKAYWIEESTQELRKATQDWTFLQRTVSEISETIAERVVHIRRQESAVRLHQKLLENKVSSGATSSSAYTGTKATELDLD